MKSKIFRVGHDKLSAKFFYPAQMKEKNPAILFIHGWTSGQDRYYMQAEDLTGEGYVCMTFDMRGHGESDGDYKVQTRQDFIDDVVAAYDLLASTEGVDPDNITVIGSSFGSYLGVLLTDRRRVKNLILRVPANYPDGPLTETIYQYSDKPETFKWRQQARTYKEVESLKYLHDFAGRIMIVESGKDELVPRQTVINYADAVKDKGKLTYIVMKNAPHSISDFPELKKEISEIVKGWLKNNNG